MPSTASTSGVRRRRRPGMADNCRSCGALIVWARHAETGKASPFDIEPDDSGNAVLWERHPGQFTYRIVGKAELELAGVVHVPHWATCPYAGSHRKSAA